MTSTRTLHGRQRWIVAGVWALTSCDANQLSGGKDGFSEEEWELVRDLSPLDTSPPDNPFNEYATDPDAAAFGHQLFFDKDFSSAVKVQGPSGAVGETGKVACSTCHDPEAYFSDPRPTGGMSHGTAYTERNSPSLVNAVYYEWFNWGGRADSLATQGGGTLETTTNAASTRLFVAHVVYAKYKDQYEAIFGALDPALDPAAPDADRFPPSGRAKSSPDAPDGPWELMSADDRQVINQIMANIGKSFEAYERNLVSGSSPFSRYLQDQDSRDFSPAARRGLALFIGKAACNECHRGPTLTDNKFHNVGVLQAADEHTPPVDEGRFEDIPALLRSQWNSAGRYSADPAAGEAKLAGLDTPDERTKGQFRTASLLNVAKTAPYFHNGSAATLEDVLWHYKMGGDDPGSYAGTLDPKARQLNLSETEVTDLIAFLNSLTGEPVAEQWRADPFAP
ncbi:MAG TPA: cytochrome c peroxidase [Polyangiaceae bacterium]|nr:cytochrome c peroxidase [Polyangiaceae bacterium]